MGLFVGLYNSQVCKALIPNDLRCCKKVSQKKSHGYLQLCLIFTTFAIVDRAQRNEPNQLAKLSIYV